MTLRPVPKLRASGSIATTTDRRDKTPDFALDWVSNRIGITERRLVTVLCCAILSTDDDETDAQAPLEEIVAAKQSVRVVIENHGGHLIQTAGSMLLAVWGYPKTRVDLARQALEAATRLRRVLPAGTGARVTLDAGHILIEPRRTASGEDTDLTGGAIDGAVAMQTRCAIGGVLASATVRQLAQTMATFSAISPHPGFRIPLYEVSALSIESANPHTPSVLGHDIARRMIGESISTMLSNGSSGGVLIEGEAGIGKSTIITEARLTRTLPSRAFWFEVACQHETRSVPLSPLQKALANVLLGAEASGGRPDLAAMVRAHLGKERYEALTQFLDAPRAQRQPPVIGQPASKSKPNDLIGEALLALADAGPLIIAVEDMQWSDSSTVAVISRLADQISEIDDVTLLITSREDLSYLSTKFRRLQWIALQRLCHEQIVGILSTRMDTRALAPSALDALAQRSEGVPLYAVELARYHTQAGGAATPMAALEAPSTLQLLVAARLDQLGELKPLVQAAAILGRRFETAALGQLVAASGRRLAPALASLVDCGVIEPEPGPVSSAFRFSHSVLRDAAYATIPREMRENMHQHAAAILAQGFVPGGPIAAELIATHHELAGNDIEAFTWWRSAAEAAIAISETSSALGHLEAALAAADRAGAAVPVQQRLDAMRLRALQLCVVYGNASKEGIEAYSHCLDLTEAFPEETSALAFDTLWGLQSCYLVRGEISKALSVGRRLALHVTDATPPTDRLLVSRINALTLLQSGHLDEAISGCTDVITTYQPERDAKLRFIYGSDQRALALTHRAWALAIMGRASDSDSDRKDALRMVRQLNHPHTTAHVTCVLAAAAETSGEREIAAAMAATGRMVAQQHHFPYWSAWAELVLGAVESSADPVMGRTMIAKAINDYQETGARQALPYAYLLLARAERQREHFSSAVAALREGIAIAEAAGVALYHAELLRVLAETLALCDYSELRSTNEIAETLERASEISAQQNAGLFTRRVAESSSRLQAQPLCKGAVV